MLIELLLQPIFWIIKTLFVLIPDISLPTDFSYYIGLTFDRIAQAGYFVPLGAISICITTILAIKGFQFAYHSLGWIIRKIPGIN